MTHDEIIELKDRILNGIDMVVIRAEKIGAEKKTYTIEELSIMSDITKDCAEALKNVTKSVYYMSEHSDERF